jgi:seryl-tRNA synthetase
MIDLALLRGPFTQKIVALICKKEPKFDATALLRADAQVRAMRHQVEEMRAEKNRIAKDAAGGPSPEKRARSIQLGHSLKLLETELETAEQNLEQLLLTCPNLPFEDVPAGNKEANAVVSSWGQKPEFNFTPQNHLALNEKLGWFDFKAGAKISGSQQLVYRKDGLKLLYALTRLMLRHNAHGGYEPVFPPYLVNEKTMVSNGSLPKFKGDFYEVKEVGLCLLPTAEVTFTGMFADSIFKEEELPLRHCAWTSCFRREAGGYGTLERGLIRIHQFEKVELYTVCKAENSATELERMVKLAETFLQTLGLHYQVSLLAAQDCSFASAKTFDIEVWLPGQGSYYEVSSCSNCTDFQARRAKIRYKDKAGKVHLCHTLNASSLALPRLMVAILETCQQADGSIKLPEILQNEMDSVW